MAKKIDVEVRNNVATIKLTDSKNLNPLNKETGKALFEALENLKDNSEVRCVIITG